MFQMMHWVWTMMRAIKRFIRGEGAFWVAHGSEITRHEGTRGDEFDFVMVPTVLQDENQGENL
ncbi:MAG: hypothetical protein ACLR0U_23430 [Enterocloster clostridioformis]